MEKTIKKGAKVAGYLIVVRAAPYLGPKTGAKKSLKLEKKYIEQQSKNK